MSEGQYLTIQRLLRNMKGLTEEESRVFIKVVEQGPVTPTEVGKILTDLGLTNSTSKPYNMLQSMEGKGVVFEDTSETKNKTYIPIHPRDLHLDLKQSFKDLDNEIGRLEQSKEISETDFDPRKDTKPLRHQLDIINSLVEFKSNGFDLTVYLKPGLLESNELLLQRLEQHKIEVEEGDINAALAIKEEKDSYGVVFINEMLNPKTREKNFYGAQILDKDLYDFVKKEVEEDE